MAINLEKIETGNPAHEVSRKIYDNDKKLEQAVSDVDQRAIKSADLTPYIRFDNMNAYATGRDVNSLKDQIDNIKISQGSLVAIANTTTIPVNSSGKLIKYAVNSPGLFTNFIDKNGKALSVASDELKIQQIELWGENNIWQKVIIRTFPNPEEALTNALANANLESMVQNLAADKTINGHYMAHFSDNRVTRLLVTGTSIANISKSFLNNFSGELGVYLGWSGNETASMGFSGGSWENPYNGWKKQPYGGFTFVRMRSDETSLPLNYSGLMKRFILRYSKEADGGTAEIWIDGVYNQTINCNGSQSYSNEAVITFDNVEFRKIMIKPSTNGYVYLETYDICQDKNGLHIIDASLGGSSMLNHLKLSTPSGLQVAGIPIVSNNGLDSIFNNTSENFKPDVIICTFTVNDAGNGMANLDNYFKPALARLVEKTQANNVQLIYIIEMGGHYSLPSDKGYATFQEILKTIRSYANHPNVTVLDWHKKSGMDTTDTDVLQTLGKRYYEVTNLNATSGTFSGDFIHPNNYGYSIGAGLLTSLFGLNPSKKLGKSRYQIRDGSRGLQGILTNTTTKNLWHPDYLNLNKTTVTASNEANQLSKYQLIGKGINVITNNEIPVWYNPEEHNYIRNFNTNIQASSKEDQWGKYIEYSNGNSYFVKPSAFTTSKVYTITLLAGPGLLSLRLPNSLFTTIINGKEVYTQQNPENSSSYIITQQTLYNDLVIVSLTIKDYPVLDTYFIITGKIYAGFITATNFACITERMINKSKSALKLFNRGVPQEHLELGRIYKENIDGRTIKKQCIATNAIKLPLSITGEGIDKRAGIFLALNRNQIFDFQLSGTTSVQEVQMMSDTMLTLSTGNPQHQNLSLNLLGIDFFEKTYTLQGLLHNYIDNKLRALISTTSTSKKLQLKQNGNWELLNGTDYDWLYNHSAALDPVSLTFKMPSESLLTQYGIVDMAKSSLQIHRYTGTDGWGEWTLAEGSDAMV